MRDAGNGHDIAPRSGLKRVPQVELWTSKTAYGTEYVGRQTNPPG